MQRRTLLKLGLGSGLLLALAGLGLRGVEPGLQPSADGPLRQSPRSRTVMGAVALAVLDGAWPAEAAERRRALQAHLDLLDGAIAGFPPAMQAELGQLLTVLSSAAGRRGLAGLASDWPEAEVPAVQAALQSMRSSRISLREQAYQALRDLHCAVFFSAPAHWSLMGYPGPHSFE